MRLTCFWSETNEDGCQFCAGACGICGTDAGDECMHDVDERHTTLDFKDLNVNEDCAKPRFVSMETISRVANSVADEELNHMFQHYLQEARKLQTPEEEPCAEEQLQRGKRDILNEAIVVLIALTGIGVMGATFLAALALLIFVLKTMGGF